MRDYRTPRIVFPAEFPIWMPPLPSVSSLHRPTPCAPPGRRPISCPALPAIREFMLSLARGLTVLEASPPSASALFTISQVAQRTQLSRASVRRCLSTLEQLGYVSQQERHFALRPRVLHLGHAYFSLDVAGPGGAASSSTNHSTRIHETSALAILDGTDILYLVRSEVQRGLTHALGRGMGLAFCFCLSPATTPARRRFARLRMASEVVATPKGSSPKAHNLGRPSSPSAAAPCTLPCGPTGRASRPGCVALRFRHDLAQRRERFVPLAQHRLAEAHRLLHGPIFRVNLQRVLAPRHRPGPVLPAGVLDRDLVRLPRPSEIPVRYFLYISTDLSRSLVFA